MSVRPKLTRRRICTDLFVQSSLSTLFCLDFFFPPVSRILKLAYLLAYYTHSSRNIKSARFHSVYRQSQHPARRRSVTPDCLGSQWTRRVWQLSILTNRFRNILALPTVFEILCLKDGNYSKTQAWTCARKLIDCKKKKNKSRY